MVGRYVSCEELITYLHSKFPVLSPRGREDAKVATYPCAVPSFPVGVGGRRICWVTVDNIAEALTVKSKGPLPLVCSEHFS